MNQSEINKFKNSENFSVASFLLPRRGRAAILTLYKFARYADEIADDSGKNSEQKIAELTEICNAIKNNNPEGLPEFLHDIFVPINNNIFSKKHLLNLLEAFIQDCTKSRYYNFNETLDYCQKSAATIGKMFLEATGEVYANTDYADKICTVLQLINHLQDLKEDYLNLNRLYFDKALIADETELNYNAENKSITESKLKILGILKKQLDEATLILDQIKSIRVRVELATIINAAYALIYRLEKKDILRRRVKLKKRQKLSCFLNALPQIFNSKANKLKFKHLFANFQSSSFFLPMLTLPATKRSKMLAFYAFCKQIDDCADANKNQYKLDFWQQELEKIYSYQAEIYPKNNISKELAILIQNQNIDKALFDEMIAGQVMDLKGEMYLPTQKKLDLYCYRVASCVGIISTKIFGYKKENQPQVTEFAEHLGKYFQYINILRDFEEDLQNNRVYLPSELMEQFSIANIAMANKAALKPLFITLSNLAKNHKELAFNALPKGEIKNMRPALSMEKIYSKYLKIMIKKGFDFKREEISLNWLQKIMLVIF